MLSRLRLKAADSSHMPFQKNIPRDNCFASRTGDIFIMPLCGSCRCAFIPAGSEPSSRVGTDTWRLPRGSNHYFFTFTVFGLLQSPWIFFLPSFA